MCVFHWGLWWLIGVLGIVILSLFSEFLSFHVSFAFGALEIFSLFLTQGFNQGSLISLHVGFVSGSHIIMYSTNLRCIFRQNFNGPYDYASPFPDSFLYRLNMNLMFWSRILDSSFEVALIFYWQKMFERCVFFIVLLPYDLSSWVWTSIMFAFYAWFFSVCFCFVCSLTNLIC